MTPVAVVGWIMAGLALLVVFNIALLFTLATLDLVLRRRRDRAMIRDLLRDDDPRR